MSERLFGKKRTIEIIVHKLGIWPHFSFTPPSEVVLVYHPVLETRMSKAVSSGETSVSRPKNVTWKLY